MPLNKLENFIKNAEGRILYVNPNDLDSTDGIENQGNSLTKPFKTIQRAMIEAARFSYLKGNDNDFVERTTILLFPGEHIVDNRPGFGIKSESGQAKAVSPGGDSTGAINTLSLTLDSNFDLTQEDNILYKFNSVNGGVIVPRGTSIVGLDLRKTKVRPKYVPNPTDNNVKQSAIFRITGACYFWQFTIFDGDELETVYTDPVSFNTANRSIPSFSHHKLTCFEYADGITRLEQYSELTDLDIYYSKLSNAYNKASANREITQKYPSAPKGFAPQRPEFEIVGAFATDPLNVTSIESGDGATPGQVVTVSTSVPHNLTGGTPIKVRGVNVADYNISTKVSSVINETKFTYLLPFVRGNLPAGEVGGLSSANAQVLVETDTVSGASPYIFNISMRSVYGMQGMHADGKRATGFKSMVVAQFTAVSLQKDDRAFVKYDKTNRRYNGIVFSKQTGELLSSGSSSTNPNTVYHLDQEANYRKGFRTTHIKVSNDAVVQIVSVFAIGFHSHFNMINGADASITNSNSNFGTFALTAEGFKKEAFAKDDKGFVTSIINPRSIVTEEQDIEYLQLDVSETSSAKAYLLGYSDETLPPSHFAQGYRIGAKVNEQLYITKGGQTFQATIVMAKGATNSTTGTSFTSEKVYKGVHSSPTFFKKSSYKLRVNHELETGESVRLISDSGNLPENIDPHRVYYAITTTIDSDLAGDEIKLASSFANAQNGVFIDSVSNLDEFNIVSRVSDKKPNDAGHPIQYDATANQWFIHTSTSGNSIHNGTSIYSGADDRDISYILRNEDNRGLDDKTYKIRYVVPKELTNGKDPTDGFVLQDSSSTNVSSNTDFTKTEITANNFDFERNTRFISNAVFVSGPPAKAVVRTDKPHNLNVGDQIIIKNIKCSINQNGLDDKGFNGTFIVTDRDNSKEFRYSNVDVEGVAHSMGTFINTTSTRDNQLPRVNRNNNNENLFVYRSTVITPYIENVQDGIYHLFVLNSNNKMVDPSSEFSDDKFNQNIVNLYPEYDRDNVTDNPPEANSFAKNFPIGDVVTNDLKKSITRETTNNFISGFDVSNTISSISLNGANTLATLTFDKEHSFESLKYVSPSSLTGGSNHIPTSGQATYHNIKLLNNTSTASNSNWDGATANVTVANGVAIAATITDGGSGYKNGEQLYFDSQDVVTGGIGGNASGFVVTSDVGISSATGCYVQITGISTGTDSYHRINSITSKNSISIHKEASDLLLIGQQVVDMGAWSSIKNKSYNATTKILSITSHSATGLLVGNSFRLLNSSNESLGDFIVNTHSSLVNATTGQLEETITATSPSDVTSPVYILKHGLSAHNAVSGVGDENVGVRGMSVYDHDYLVTNEDIDKSETSIQILLPNGNTVGENIMSRFPIGSYVQVNDEIMRIAKNTLGGGQAIEVIRGVLGSRNNTHKQFSHLKKIKPLPIELRRPSILRASGHTFEYVGYGPGNYSTALPQLQNRTLSEREEFLSQAQETSCGNVVYTGMNDKGDFYIGNTKTSSASGQQTTFDIPVPTITGEDPNRLSIVADEVIVKERLLVEGGTSKNILSQFDGPVTFNGTVRYNDNLSVQGILNANNTLNSSSTTTGSLVVKGGVGIAKSMHIGGDINGTGEFDGNSNISGFNNVTATNFIGNGAQLTNTGAALSEPTSGTQRIVLTDKTGTVQMTTAATEAGLGGNNLDYNFATHTLTSTNFSGALTGNASSATLSTNVVGAANRILFNSALNTTATSDNLNYNDSTGQLTGTNLNINVMDNKVITAGTGNDLVLTHDGTDSYVRHINSAQVSGSELRIQSAGNLILEAYDPAGGNPTFIKCFNATNNYVKLFYNNAERFETTSVGIKVTGQIEATGDVIAFSASDMTFKKDISPIQNALDMINKLSGNTFTWSTDLFTLLPYENGTKDTGILAQEVEALGLPGVTTTRGDGVKAVRYDRLIPVLIEAVKELTAKVNTLENK